MSSSNFFKFRTLGFYRVQYARYLVFGLWDEFNTVMFFSERRYAGSS